MAGFTDFLFNGQTPPAVTSATNTGGSLPLWYSSYLSTLANQAGNIASQPYQTYDGARIAPQDPQEQQGYDFMGQNATSWQAPLQQAQQGAGNVAGGFNQGEFEKYKSPYMSGVVDEIGRLGTRNLNENLMPALQDQFVSSGQFGSDRNRTMAERLTRDVGADITGQQGQALQGSFANAMQNYNTGQQTASGASQNLGGLAQMQQALTTGTAGGLSASGQTNRAFGQGNMDLAYQDFLNQQNYPRQNVSFLSNTLRGTQVPTSQDQTTTQPFNGTMSPSPLATFAGMSLAGLGMKTGGYAKRAIGAARVRALPIPSQRMSLPAPRGGLELMAA